MMSNFFRCRIGIVQRSKNGSAIARAAYQACTEMTAPDGTKYDFTSNRETHGHTKTVMLVPPECPDWAHDPQKLWDRAVRSENRCNAQEARTIEISLPRELPLHLHEACVRHLIAPFVEVGMIAQADFHLTMACDGGPNGHCHVEMTMRRVVNGEFSRQKARDWNSMFLGRAQQVRTEMASRLNEFCRLHGIDYYADPRCNAARDLPEPEPTLPRWNWLSAKRTGTRTAWLQENEEHRLARARIAQLEEELRQTERAIQTELELMANRERKRAADREAFIRRRVHLHKSERREALPRRHLAEDFEALSSAPPEPSMECVEPTYPRPP